MAIALEKGGNISLSKEAPGLKAVFVGLGWDERETDGEEFDLDASAFLLQENGKVRDDADFILATLCSLNSAISAAMVPSTATLP